VASASSEVDVAGGRKKAGRPIQRAPSTVRRPETLCRPRRIMEVSLAIHSASRFVRVADRLAARHDHENRPQRSLRGLRHIFGSQTKPRQVPERRSAKDRRANIKPLLTPSLQAWPGRPPAVALRRCLAGIRALDACPLKSVNHGPGSDVGASAPSIRAGLGVPLLSATPLGDGRRLSFLFDSCSDSCRVGGVANDWPELLKTMR